MVVRSYASEGLINNIRMLEVVIGEEIELVEEVPNINTA